MQIESHDPSARSAHVLVLPEDEIVDLVKESEVRTGKPGRRFVIHGAERLAYRVLTHPGGLEIARLAGRGRPFGGVYVPARSFEQHPIAHAQRAGCLFTPPLSS